MAWEGFFFFSSLPSVPLLSASFLLPGLRAPCAVNLHDCFASRFKFDGEFTIGLSAYWMAVGTTGNAGGRCPS